MHARLSILIIIALGLMFGFGGRAPSVLAISIPPCCLTPQPIPGGADQGYVSLAGTADGITHAVWPDAATSSAAHRIGYSQLAPGGSWSAPVDVSATAEDTRCVTAVSGPANSVHVVWIESGSGTLRYRSRASDGTWTAAPGDVLDVGLPSNSCLPAIAVEADGAVHVAWDDGNVVYRVRPSGGVWSSLETVKSGTLGNYQPSLAVTRDGTAHVAWGDGYHAPTLLYASKPTGGSWSSPVGIAPALADFESSKMLAGSDGRVHLTYRAGGSCCADIHYQARDTAGNWSAPVDVSNSYPSQAPSMTWLPGGAIGLVWMHGGPYYDLWYAELPPSGSWSAPAQIATSSYARAWPSIAGAADNVTAAWTEGPDGGRQAKYITLASAPPPPPPPPECGPRQIVFIRGIVFKFSSEDAHAPAPAREWADGTIGSPGFDELRHYLQATYGYGDEDLHWFNYGTVALGTDPSDQLMVASDTRKPLSDLADNLEQQLNTWHDRCSAARFDIISHSLGGAVAAMWASKFHHEWLNSVVTLESPLGGASPSICGLGELTDQLSAQAGSAGIDLCTPLVKTRMLSGLDQTNFMANNDLGDPVVNGCIAYGMGKGGPAWPWMAYRGHVWDSSDYDPTPCPAGVPVADLVVAYLSRGEHGRPLTAACGCWGLIDKQQSSTFVDDRSVTYSGAAAAWTREALPSRIRGGMNWSWTSGSLASVSFDPAAKSITWITARGLIQGRAKVTVCGTQTTEITLFSPLSNTRAEETLSVPATCYSPRIDVEVIPLIPSQHICIPTIRLPRFTIPGRCFDTPAVTRQVQVDGFEVRK